MVTRGAHPVGVLIVAAVLGEGCFRPLGEEDLGTDVAVTGGPSPDHRPQGHLTERRGAARHRERRLVPEVREKKNKFMTTFFHFIYNCDR